MYMSMNEYITKKTNTKSHPVTIHCGLLQKKVVGHIRQFSVSTVSRVAMAITLIHRKQIMLWVETPIWVWHPSDWPSLIQKSCFSSFLAQSQPRFWGEFRSSTCAHSQCQVASIASQKKCSASNGAVNHTKDFHREDAESQYLWLIVPYIMHINAER